MFNLDVNYEALCLNLLTRSGLSSYYIHRRWKDFIDDINRTAIYEEVPFTNPIAGEIMTVFNQLNPGEDVFHITNSQDVFRNYDGLQLTANHRASEKLYLSASLVISRTTGNVDNTEGSNGGITPCSMIVTTTLTLVEDSRTTLHTKSKFWDLTIFMVELTVLFISDIFRETHGLRKSL